MTPPSILASFAAYLAVDVLAKAAQVAVLLWVAHEVPKETYGLLGLHLALQQFLAFLLAGGLPEAAQGRYNALPVGERPAFAASVVRALGTRTLRIGLACAVVLGLTLTFASLAGLTTAATLAAVLATAAFQAGNRVLVTLRQVREDHVGAAWSKSGLVLAGAAGAALGVAVWPADPVAGYFVGSATAMAIVAATDLLAARRYGKHTERQTLLRRTLESDAAPYLAPSLIGWLFGYGYNTVIAATLPGTAVADFTVALLLASAAPLVATAVQQAWAPRFAALHPQGDAARLNESNTAVWRRALLFTALAGSGVTVAWAPVAVAIGGQLAAYRHLAPTIAIIYAAHLVFYLHYAALPHFVAHHRGARYAMLSATATMAGLAIAAVLIVRFGERGAYLGYFAALALRGVALHVDAARRWHVSFPWASLALGLGALWGAAWIAS